MDTYVGVTKEDIEIDLLKQKIARLERIVQILADVQNVDLDREWDPDKYLPVDTRTVDEIYKDGAWNIAKTLQTGFFESGLPEEKRSPKRPIIHVTDGFGVHQHSLPPSRHIHEYKGIKRTVHDNGQEAVDALYEQYEKDLQEHQRNWYTDSTAP